ncbi:hypothetical protein XalbCFBP2523_14885 [Xanthomonas albilineans]|nr:hypothetical protein XalbCFBP2523_14885 [Xanthomonas albilineans]
MDRQSIRATATHRIVREPASGDLLIRADELPISVTGNHAKRAEHLSLSDIGRQVAKRVIARKRGRQGQIAVTTSQACTGNCA